MSPIPQIDPALRGRAVLFDLDDTIVDFSGNQATAWEETCQAVVEEMPDLDASRLHATIRATADWYWGDPVRHRAGRQDLRATTAEIVRLSFVRLGLTSSPISPRDVADFYRDLRDEGLALIDGAAELLEELHAAGSPLALVTNGSAADQRAKLERFELEDRFDHVQIEGEFGAGKPDPDVYRAALDALAVDAAYATFVGDNPEWDVRAPMRLGMQAVWVDVAGAGLRSTSASVTPSRVVRTIAELRAEPRA